MPQTDEKVYPAVIDVSKGRVLTTCVLLVRACSSYEAEGKVLAFGKKKFPSNQGYDGHRASVGCPDVVLDDPADAVLITVNI